MRPFLLALLIAISACFQPAFATELAAPYRAAVVEMLDGAAIVESYLVGLQLGLSGGEKATPDSKALAARVVAQLGEQFLRDKLVELYAQKLGEAQVREIVAFQRTPAGQQWRQIELRYIALRQSGRSPDQTKRELEGFAPREHVEAINFFTNQMPTGQALRRTQAEVDKEMTTLLRPKIMTLLQNSR